MLIDLKTDPAAAADSNPSTEPNVPLIVDMDGTLVRTDTLHEALLGIVSRDPASLIKIPGWLKGGKAAFKSEVITRTELDPALLPLRDEVVDLVKAARAEGRKVILCSASHQEQVDSVAKHVGIFDEAIGSDATKNLAGTAKADYLVERFGAKGFDYVGDSKADLKVWPQARQAIFVGGNNAARAALKGAHQNVRELDEGQSTLAAARVYFKAMRPHQWLKNMLVFVPMLAAHDFSSFGLSLIAFFSFCLAASSIYLINDMLDLDADRRHPRKRNRPFASGALPVKQGMIQFGVLALGSVVLALFVNPLFLPVLIGYVALTTAYSLVLKRKLMIDIWTLGALYSLRMIGGAAATGIPTSEWLLAFSMFLFLSLAAVKRQSELADLQNRGMTTTEGRGYRVSDLPILLGVVLAAGYCSVLVLALYVSSAASSGLYSEPRLLWLVCPLLLYWISRATIISYRGEMDDDPIIFAIKDRVSQIVFAFAGVLIVLGAML